MHVANYRRCEQPSYTGIPFHGNCFWQFGGNAVSAPSQELRFRLITPARFVFFLVLICIVASSVFLDAAQEKPLSQATISDLIKNRVSQNRIAQLIEDHGVDFALDDRISRRLKQDGANDSVLAAVKRMSDRYVEEQQRKKRIAEEEVRRRKEAERDRLEQEAKAKGERERQEQAAKAKAEKERHDKEDAAKAKRERQEKEAAQKAEKERQLREAKAKAERERQEQAAKVKAEKERL